MISLKEYIDDKYLIEADEEDKDKKDNSIRSDIQFTVWQEPDKKVTDLENNDKYQKIEYKHEDKKKKISIDFLLGFQDGSWKLWIGKIGSCSYDDDPYCSFETKKFAEGIVAALDKVEEFLEMVEEDPQNYVQYYINM
jgi:hypothetical protein